MSDAAPPDLTEIPDLCRACGGGGLSGDGSRCGSCHGAWVSALALLDLVAEVAGAPLGRLPWVDRTRPTSRACEVCRAPMRAVSLYRIALDRCDAHGIWLDADELESVLREAPRHHAAFVPPPARSTWTDAQQRQLGDAIGGDPDSPLAARRDGLIGALGKLFG